jgi:Leucine-rich repeat (LRR) protein
LQNNIIQCIENISELTLLSNLNLASNHISAIANLGCLENLQTINLSSNKLSTATDIEELRLCRACTVLDLSYNNLDGPVILDVVGDMENLKVLILMGNPIVRRTKDYRLILTVSHN